MDTPYKSPDASLTQGHMMSCKACAKEIHSSAPMCPHCGASRRTSRYKNKTVAALMAFLLGGFGGHRFYLGQWWGILYLLLFWTLIPGIIAFIEFIYFLVRDQKKWDEKYNEGIAAGPNESSGGGVIAVIVIGVFVAIFMIGVLAAVALPAYQDYTVRARVASAIAETAPLKVKVQEFYIENQRLPSSGSDVGIQAPFTTSDGHLVTVRSGNVKITFRDETQLLNSKTLIFTPELSSGSAFSWGCLDGSVENKYLPSKCRK